MNPVCFLINIPSLSVVMGYPPFCARFSLKLAKTETPIKRGYLMTFLYKLYKISSNFVGTIRVLWHYGNRCGPLGGPLGGPQGNPEGYLIALTPTLSLTFLHSIVIKVL